MKLTTTFATAAIVPLALAQNVVVPDTCVNGTMAGTDTAIVTVPYTYAQVLSIIGSYQNLTWSGSPAGSVTLNGSDNTVGTARTYDIAGAHVIETILIYDSPPGGPYYEVHNTAPLMVPSANLSFYIPYDATTVMSVCGGAATMFNFTANFCANNASATAAVLHMLHSTDGLTVGQFLGGQNFTTCAALTGGNASTTNSSSGPQPTTYKGVAGALSASGAWTVLAAGVVGAVMVL